MLYKCSLRPLLYNSLKTKELDIFSHTSKVCPLRLKSVSALISALHQWNFTTALCCWSSSTTGKNTKNNDSGELCLYTAAEDSLNHLFVDWEPTGWLTAYLDTGCVMKERQRASHLALPIMNQGEMNGFQGQSRKHLAMLIAAHAIYASQPEEWFPCVCSFRLLNPLCNDWKRSCVELPQWPVFF